MPPLAGERKPTQKKDTTYHNYLSLGTWLTLWYTEICALNNDLRDYDIISVNDRPRSVLYATYLRIESPHGRGSNVSEQLSSLGEELLVSNGNFYSVIALVLAHRSVGRVARTNLFSTSCLG